MGHSQTNGTSGGNGLSSEINLTPLIDVAKMLSLAQKRFALYPPIND